MGADGKWDVNKSWHAAYRHSAYIFCGGLPFDLTEGDLIVVFSQFGEIVDVNMPRDPTTGKPRGFAFLAYEDQRSTVLAVDNFNGATLLNRTIRVDHCSNYKDEREKAARTSDPAEELSAEDRRKEEERERANAGIRQRKAAKAEFFRLERGELNEDDLIAAEAAQRARHEREQREGQAVDRLRARVDELRARHRQVAEQEMSAEERAQAELAERRRRRDEERMAAAQQRPEQTRDAPKQDPHPEPEKPDMPVDDARWDRMLNGGKKKKKSKHTKRAREGDDGQGGGSVLAGGSAKESLSVEETNRVRKELGLPPLR